MKLILASSSPQRKRIMEDLKLKFEIIPSGVEEDYGDLKDPQEIAMFLAHLKAKDVAQKHKEDWVIGCDTIVVLDNGHISMKPKNRDKAKWTLQQYKNSYADVYSGLALMNIAEDKEYVEIERTRLFFHDFTDEDIENYLDLNHWQGSSGSMTIEGEGGKLIKDREGEYENVVGLPVQLLRDLLHRENLMPKFIDAST